MKQNIIYLNS